MTGSEQLMLVAALQTSLEHDDAPPTGLDGPLESLWHVGKGNYERARKLLEPDFSKEAAWVRAHLHRRKGEHDEALEWYGKAGKDPSSDDVETEWSKIAVGLLLKL